MSQNFSQLDFPASHNGLIKINPNPNTDSNFLDSGLSDVLWISFQKQGQEKKNKHIGLHPTKNRMHSTSPRPKKKSIKVNLLNRRRCFQTTYPIKSYINIKYSYSLRAKKKKNKFKNGQRIWIDIFPMKIFIWSLGIVNDHNIIITKDTPTKTTRALCHSWQNCCSVTQSHVLVFVTP